MAPKAIDLTGQVFGELTVMRRVPNVDDGYGRSKVAWLCRCSCGREVVYTTQVLRQRPYGKTSCGCKPPDPGPWAPAAHAQDVQRGFRSGRLTVIGDAAQGRWFGRRVRCACSCGAQVDVSAYALASGQVKSCGCLQREVTSIHNTEDLLGKRFGELRVIARAQKSEKTKHVCWVCKCDCGNIVVVRGDRLTQGKSTACRGHHHKAPHSQNNMPELAS